MRTRLVFAAGLAAALAAGAAQAHVVFAQSEARAGAHWAGALRVGHGCKGGLATTSIRVEIPEGINVARPQPKPGWTVKVERQPLAEPALHEGKPITERVRALVWTGRLPDEQFDEFGLAAKLPAEPGALAFKVIQTCEGGEARWTEIPVAGAPRPEFPAAMLTLKAADGGHAH